MPSLDRACAPLQCLKMLCKSRRCCAEVEAAGGTDALTALCAYSEDAETRAVAKVCGAKTAAPQLPNSVRAALRASQTRTALALTESNTDLTTSYLAGCS